MQKSMTFGEIYDEFETLVVSLPIGRPIEEESNRILNPIEKCRIWNAIALERASFFLRCVRDYLSDKTIPDNPCPAGDY